MSFTRNIALAGTFAVALLASSAAPADSARPVNAVAAASTAALVPQTVVASSVMVVRLTPADMSAVQGEGFRSWFKRTVRKLQTWLQRNVVEPLQKIVDAIQEIIDVLEDLGQDNQPVDTTDNFQNDVTTSLVYDEAGNLLSSSESQTGFVYTGTTVSGGGGGDYCQNGGSGPDCQFEQ
jgi:hypothetical protein